MGGKIMEFCATIHSGIPAVITTTTTSREVRTGVTTSVVEEFAETRADRMVLSLIHI